MKGQTPFRPKPPLESLKEAGRFVQEKWLHYCHTRQQWRPENLSQDQRSLNGIRGACQGYADRAPAPFEEEAKQII